MELLDAFQLADRLHAGEVDKAGKPMITHLVRVLLRVQAAGGSVAQEIAALLHDSVEGKKATGQSLSREGVPADAIRIVLVLSRRDDETYAEYVQRVAQDPDAVPVKRADLMDNDDPTRLAMLPLDVAQSLHRRYKRALEVLGERPPTSSANIGGSLA